MVIEHQVKIKIILQAIKQPWVRITVNDQQHSCQINQQVEFEYEFQTRNSSSVVLIEHFDKDCNDSQTAVEIVGIEFFGISDPKFIWAGTYYPKYPEPWLGQQTNKPAEYLPAQTYLGWNGIYQLEFSVPVFEWMHNTLNLGWIYR